MSGAEREPGPREREVRDLASEEITLLRRRDELEAARADHLAQAEVQRLELESIGRRLTMIRGKRQGVELGRAFHDELVTEQIRRKEAEKAAEDDGAAIAAGGDVRGE